MSAFAKAISSLKGSAHKWLVTGVAGFVGSNLLEELLRCDQEVAGLDNFSTGKRENLEEVFSRLSDAQRERFRLIEGDIRNPATCQEACSEVDVVLHQAALGSVPRSIGDPLASHENNVTGFVNMLNAAREQGVRRFVYASSSSVYGDSVELPKIEERTGRPLSPYAATKVANELYAGVFARTYAVETIGLRYFNVFGPHQDPNGPYAAVIPRWGSNMINNEPTCIYGDGSTSRDFCFVANAVQANILAAVTSHPDAINEVFNVALNARTTLNELFELIREKLLPSYSHLHDYRPVYKPFRAGDVQHSQADISKARTLLGFEPMHTVEQGLDVTLDWFQQKLAKPTPKMESIVQEAA
jgi:UDP-N-acetylglucosamine 4-epimerase